MNVFFVLSVDAGGEDVVLFYVVPLTKTFDI